MANESELANNAQLPDFVSDCRLMLRFARKNGTDLPPELEHEIAQLDLILKPLKLPPVSDIPPVLVSDIGLGGPAGTAAVDPSRSTTELILRVHAELSKVITPATALSLQTTEPPPTGHRFFGGMPLVVKAAAVAALIFAFGFVGSAAFIAAKAAKDAIVAQQKVNVDNEAKKTEDPKIRTDGEGEKK